MTSTRQAMAAIVAGALVSTSFGCGSSAEQGTGTTIPARSSSTVQAESALGSGATSSTVIQTTSSTAIQATSSTTTPAPTSTADSRLVVEVESSPGTARVMPRGHASAQRTVLLLAGGSVTLRFTSAVQARYTVSVGYSNDGPGTPPEEVAVSVDGNPVGGFAAENTRSVGLPGEGWDQFGTSGQLGPIDIAPGSHTVTLAVRGGDAYGAEMDVVVFTRV